MLPSGRRRRRAPVHETSFAGAARMHRSPGAAASRRRPRRDSRDSARPGLSTTDPHPRPSIHARANRLNTPRPSHLRPQRYHDRVLGTSEKRSKTWNVGTLEPWDLGTLEPSLPVCEVRTVERLALRAALHIVDAGFG